MINTVINTAIVIGKAIMTDKDLEAQDVAMNLIMAFNPLSAALKNCLSTVQMNSAANLGLREVQSNMGQTHLVKGYIDLGQKTLYNGEFLSNAERIKQGLSPLDSISSKEICVFKNAETGVCLEATEQEFNRNFNGQTFVCLKNETLSLYWQERWAHINLEFNALELPKLKEWLTSSGMTFSEENGLWTAYRDKTKVLEINPDTKSGWALVGIYKKGCRTPFLSGVKPGQFNCNIEYRYDVRGNFYNKLGNYISVTRNNGEGVQIPIVVKKEMLHGMMVSYNVPDFDNFALASIDIPDQIISLEAQHHKSYAIQQLAELVHNGKIDKNLFSPEVLAQLEKVRTNNKVYVNLCGLELHHDGNGRIQFIPNDIHCRHASHLSGSWLMNHKNYRLDLLSDPDKFASFVQNAHLESSDPLDKQMAVIIDQSGDRLEKYPIGSVDERKTIITDLAHEMTSSLNLKQTSITIKPLPKYILGRYDTIHNAIVLNDHLFTSALDCDATIKTLLHEIRHAIQCDAIKNPSNYAFEPQILKRWRDDIKHSVCGEYDFETYAKQSIEIDAARWAEENTPHSST